MTAPTHPLLDATLDRVGTGWAAKLKIGLSALMEPGVRLVPRESSTTLFVLKLQDSVVIVHPPLLATVLSPLSQNELLDMTLLLLVLDDYKPVPFGTASIAYADVSTLSESSNLTTVRIANARDLDTVMSRCTQDEQEESGLANMPNLLAALSADGGTVAVAGYETWNGEIAQMGVLAIPSQRGRGLVFSAAHAAAQAALENELIPQWRCRIGNQSSYRLGQRLGFHELGRQLAIDLTM